MRGELSSIAEVTIFSEFLAGFPMNALHGLRRNVCLFLIMRVRRRAIHALLIVGTLHLFSCRAATTTLADPIKAIAVAKLGEGIESWPNASGQYILFSQKPGNNVPGVIKFIVVHVSSRQVVEEQNYQPGYVKWVTETSLEVLSMPGMAKTTDDPATYIKVINLRTPN